MSSTPMTPITLAGIKRHATRIKKAMGIQHSQALNEAAIQVGFQNFRHAQNELSPPAKLALTVSGYTLKLSAYWNDLEEGRCGKESLSVTLSAPWDTLVRPDQLNNTIKLRGFRLESTNHLSTDARFGSQLGARARLRTAARTFQFMDTTGLRPSAKGYSRAYPLEDSQESYRIPGEDHVTIWFDSNKRYLITDEPYEDRVTPYEAKRQLWIERYGYTMAKPDWPGMHNPDGGTRLYLFTSARRGVPLSPIVAALNKLAALPERESAWAGESSSTPVFSRLPNEPQSKMDLLLYDALVKHATSSLNINLLAAELRCPDDQIALRNKLRRMEAERFVFGGLVVKVDGETVHLHEIG